MTEGLPQAQVADELCEDCGYQPELKRTLVVLLLQAVLVIASTQLVGLITSEAAGLELLIVVLLTVALGIAVVVTGHGSLSNLTSQGVATGAPNYFAVGGGLMAATIMGITTFVGFDAAANRAEEPRNRSAACRALSWNPLWWRRSWEWCW